MISAQHTHDDELGAAHLAEKQALETRISELVAKAESDVIALQQPVEAFDHLMSEHPVLAAKLLKNMSLHLADRVRVLTGDLARWVSRAAGGGGLQR